MYKLTRQCEGVIGTYIMRTVTSTATIGPDPIPGDIWKTMNSYDLKVGCNIVLRHGLEGRQCLDIEVPAWKIMEISVEVLLKVEGKEGSHSPGRATALQVTNS